MLSPPQAWYLFRHLGPRVLALRARGRLRHALGTLDRRFPSRAWESLRLSEINRPGVPAEAADYAAFRREHAPPFLFPLGRPPTLPLHLASGGERRPALRDRLQLLEENRCVLFFNTASESEPDWWAQSASADRPHSSSWFEIGSFDPALGDVRTAWEPARAAWALDLARARAHGIVIDAAGLFFHWLDGWMAASPPHVGVHWMCGQESSVRLMAVALAFWSLADEPQTTPERWVQLARLAWATGYRVYHHIDYALSQKNNHALSEACGLLLVSHLFPEFREAQRWQQHGRQVIDQELHRQIYPDGSYVQHSMNYHRVMLYDAILALRLAELAGAPFQRDLYDLLGRAEDFLFEMIEPRSGRLPNYGNNDGSDILPLTECDFTDYRPAIQAAHYLVHRRRLLPPGPWDEELLWLFGPESLVATLEPERDPASSAFDAGGYYTLRQPQSWAMIRCHTYRDRMPQCDPLHLDLWWRGLNVLQDCGTYQYYTPDRPDIEYYFKSIRAHNTVEIDGRDPATAVSRFLWLPWIRARTRRYSAPAGGPLVFEGEHYGYDRAPWHVLHRRTVLGFPGDLWVVVDDLLGEGEHDAILRWHLLDAPYRWDKAAGRLVLDTPEGPFAIAVTARRPLGRAEVVCGRVGPAGIQGLASRYYSEMLPVPTIELAVHWRDAERIVTGLCPGSELEIKHDGTLERWEFGAAAAGGALRLRPPLRAGEHIFLSAVSEAMGHLA